VVPAELTRDRLQAAIDAQQALLEPADIKAFAVLVAKIFEFARTFGLANPDTEAATKFYREALSDLPPDLLQRAVSDVVREWKWGNKIPLPADIRNQVEAELTARKVMLVRLEMAEKRAPMPVSSTAKFDTSRLVSAAIGR